MAVKSIFASELAASNACVVHLSALRTGMRSGESWLRRYLQQVIIPRSISTWWFPIRGQHILIIVSRMCIACKSWGGWLLPRGLARIDDIIGIVSWKSARIIEHILWGVWRSICPFPESENPGRQVGLGQPVIYPLKRASRKLLHHVGLYREGVFSWVMKVSRALQAELRRYMLPVKALQNPGDR